MYRQKRLLIIPLIGGIMALGAWFILPLNAQQGDCAVGQPLSHTLAAGSSWDLCWSIADAEGVLLHQVHYTTPDGLRRQMIKEASVAQIIVSPDDGSPDRHYLPESGLGSEQLLPLAQDECPDGQLITNEETAVLCQQVKPRSYIYRYFDEQKQGEYLSIFSVSQTEGEQFYIVEWRFYDDGTIEPLVGDAGTLASPSSEGVNSGYVTNVFWRLDIDIGLNGDDDLVEQIEIEDIDQGERHGITVTQILTETARTVSPDTMRTWRVRAGTLVNEDGHPVSYQLEARNVGHQYVGNQPIEDAPAEDEAAEDEPVDEAPAPWSQHQLTVTALDPCERLATQNPPTDGCGTDISQFSNGESLNGRDVVFWYRASLYRQPRGEDALAKNVQWLSYQLIPRDWTSTNELVDIEE